MSQVIEKDSRIPAEKRIVFLGDSITDQGTFIAFLDAYFQQQMPDKKMKLINLGVSSETASGLTESDHPFPRPCIHNRLLRALQESKPEWVVICYGMNDGIYYPYSDERFQAYQEGILRAIQIIQNNGAKAIVMTPPPFDPGSINEDVLQPEGREAYSYLKPYVHYNEVLRRYSDWLLTLNSIADGIVNIYDPLLQDREQKRKSNPAYLSGDGIHPNASGHWLIAKSLLDHLFNISLEQIPEYVEHPEQSEIFALVLERHLLLSSAWKEHVGHSNPNKAEALLLDQALIRGEEIAAQIRERAAQEDRHSMKASVWKGYERIDFYLEGREGIVILPKFFAEGRPWVWRAEFFDAFATVDMALLEQGWPIAYYRLSNMYGCPYELMHQFQSHLIQTYELSQKAVIFGFSRGGLYAVNYAVTYPECVAALYLDAPVLDIRMWPGGKGKGSGSSIEWEKCLAVYGLTDENSIGFTNSPLDCIDSLSGSDIPIIIVAGDVDEDVILSENAALLEKRYRQLNGKIKMIVKPGMGHHPHSLEDPKPIIDYIKLYV
ncbi:GDSL-type esterase/lipase family protein [Paenibacillus sp. GP183]|uniref:SGNH/GDSL hydrolase family protein n=1 Tax=Paenibacillus sp. GP183 TaxID=1882751 RepID=UPI00089D51AE|nr:GDSL-type esterase/lipase family protein [Paenibacillus sp. GP183]SEB81439.1 Lysophospholipase L1 [Paenibacillus sp. GP183]